MVSDSENRLDVLCERRELLRAAGGLALSSLVLPGLVGMPSMASAATAAVAAGGNGRASSCILVYLLGGPPHLDMFDLKPEAPAEIRGPFSPIATTVPGLQICELMPRLAGMAQEYALIRSVSHPNGNHTPMIYYTLTGRHTANPNLDNDVRPPQAADFPHTGSVISRLCQRRSDLPGYVAIPELAVRSSLSGEFKRARQPLRGGAAGILGPQFDPLCVDGDPGARGAIPSLVLPDGVAAERFEARSALLSTLERGVSPATSSKAYHELRSRAVVLTGAANAGNAELFSLDCEPASMLDRYGRHRFGRAMLMARRLTEAGVPMVAVHWNEMTICDGWDTHSKNFDALKSELLPMLDQGLSALLEDLGERNRLGETVVACLGEFGRTPKINGNAGRDHWGQCSTTLLAGGGLRGGAVMGSSDKQAAFPASEPVDPVDVQATMYHCLGLDAETTIPDRLGRPHRISDGRVLHELIG